VLRASETDVKGVDANVRVADRLATSVPVRVDVVTDGGRLKALFNIVSSYGVRPVHPGTSVTLYEDPRRISRDGPI
jgi:hypothetical protein